MRTMFSCFCLFIVMYCILRTERKEKRSEKIEVKWKEKKRKVDKVWWDRESHFFFFDNQKKII